MRTRSVVGAALAVVAAWFGAGPAGAFVVIGPTQVPDPFLTQDINVPNPTMTLNQGAPIGVRLTSPIDGVITSWRTYSGMMSEGAAVQLRVLQAEGGGVYRVLGSGPLEFPSALNNGKATEQSFTSRIPIPVGATIGVQRTKTSGANIITIVHDQTAPSPWLQGWYSGGAPDPPADGDAAAPLTVNGTDGSSDAFFPISAIVEPDTDQDDFGDETQDRCPGTAGTDAGCSAGAFQLPAAPAQGATLLGPNLDPNPATVVNSNRPSPSIVLNLERAPGVQLQARFRGVVTRWSFYTGDVTDGSSAQLRVLRRLGDSDFQAIASGPVETLSPGTGPATLRTFASRVPVLPGDHIGVGLQRASAGTLQVTAEKTELSPSPWVWGHLSGATGNGRFINDGEIAYPSTQSIGLLGNTFLPINAVVERDGDGDLFGDHTQDRCLNSPGPIDGCPAPVTPAPPPPAAPQPTVQVNTVVPAGASAVIDLASVRFTRGRRTLSVRLSCPAQRATRCAGRLTAKTAGKIRTGSGKRRALTVGSAGFSIAQGTTRTLQLKVSPATRSALRSLRRVKLALTLGTSTKVSKTVQ